MLNIVVHVYYLYIYSKHSFANDSKLSIRPEITLVYYKAPFQEDNFNVIGKPNVVYWPTKQ